MGKFNRNSKSENDFLNNHISVVGVQNLEEVVIVEEVKEEVVIVEEVKEEVVIVEPEISKDELYKLENNKRYAYLEAMIEEMKADKKELAEKIEKVQIENENLKKRKVLSLDHAKELYDKRIILNRNKTIFDNAKTNIENGIKKLEPVNDYDNVTFYNLTFSEFNNETAELVKLFSITNVLILKEVLNIVNQKVNSKINDITNEIKELETL